MRYKEAVMKRILLEGIMNLGDLVASTAAVSYLRRQYPQWEIYYLIRPGFEDVLATVPGVRGTIAYAYKSGGGFTGIWKLAQNLRAYHFDAFLTFDPRKRTSLAVRLAGIPLRIDSTSVFGWHDRTYFFNRHISLDGFDLEEHQTYQAFVEVVRRVRAANLLPLHGTANEKKDGNEAADTSYDKDSRDKFYYTEYRPVLIRDTLSDRLRGVSVKERFSVVSPYVVITPSRRGSKGVWPIENWIGVIQDIVKDNYQAVLVGSREESVKIKTILMPKLQEVLMPTMYKKVIDTSGQTSLIELMNLLSKAHLVVNIDNGVGHLAAALERPVLTLFDDYSDSAVIHKPAGKYAEILTGIQNDTSSISKVREKISTMLQII